MTPKQISALQGIILAILSALVAAGTIDPGMSDTLTGLVAAALTVLAAFFVTAPSDH
jgi:hypothetical protein